MFPGLNPGMACLALILAVAVEGLVILTVPVVGEYGYTPLSVPPGAIGLGAGIANPAIPGEPWVKVRTDVVSKLVSNGIQCGHINTAQLCSGNPFNHLSADRV